MESLDFLNVSYNSKKKYFATSEIILIINLENINKDSFIKNREGAKNNINLESKVNFLDYIKDNKRY